MQKLKLTKESSILIELFDIPQSKTIVTTPAPTNYAIIRHVAFNLSEDLIGKCVLVIDGIIQTKTHRTQEFDGKKYLQIDKSDIIAYL